MSIGVALVRLFRVETVPDTISIIDCYNKWVQKLDSGTNITKKRNKKKKSLY